MKFRTLGSILAVLHLLCCISNQGTFFTNMRSNALCCNNVSEVGAFNKRNPRPIVEHQASELRSLGGGGGAGTDIVPVVGN